MAAAVRDPNKPSLNEFQSQILEHQRLRMQGNQISLADVVANLSIDDQEEPVPIEDYLLAEDTGSKRATLTVILDRALDKELLIQLGSHNIRSHSLVSLFESPDNEPDDLVLPSAKKNEIVENLSQIAKDINAELSVVHDPFEDSGIIKRVQGQRGIETESSVNPEEVTDKWTSKCLWLLIRRIPEGAKDLTEIRVAVVGNVDAGKSSLLGVLTKGRLDDGRGRARVSLFRHKHEIESGRTSSVGMELLGFSPAGQQVLPESALAHLQKVDSEFDAPNTSRRQQFSWEEIAAKASKVISFSDLAGHERYLKTTLFGLTATNPDFVLLIVGANAGIVGMSKEHLAVALALSVPIVCVVTKIDMTPPHIIEQSVKQLAKVLRSPGCRKQPVFVKDTGMACKLASGFIESKIAPIFMCSNVTGEGLPILKTFLNTVPVSNADKYPVNEQLECSISDVFSVPFVGTVVSGLLLAGRVSVGDSVLIGPDSLGAFTTTAVKSIQRKRVNVPSAEAGQSVSFALKRVKRQAVRKGMVIVSKESTPKAVKRFEGSVLVLFHNTTISPRYSAMLHSGSIRQTVTIDAILEKPCIRTGDRATIQFSFIKCPEYIKEGDRFLFREGRTRALGVVTKCLP